MERVRFTWLVCALTIVAGASAGCRDYTPQFLARPHANASNPPTVSPARRDAAPRTSAIITTSGTPNPVIAGIYLNAGCTINPDEMAVAAGHVEAENCEHILATAYTGTNGDMDETAAPIEWSVTDWSDLTLNCIGTHNNLCAARMTEDYFDLGDATEPASIVTACTTNSCAAWDADCEPSICASVTIKSVINLEGPWSFDPISEPADLTIDLWQTGRTIFAASNDMDHASVSGFSVLFDRGDYRYIGTIAPDRAHIEGYALDLISFLPAGSWSAHRL